ncbi:FHA domain-containing protein [Rubritalea sp.]|uniref:FHA domain-containing protein n=1 Tax=Rubritalea sp. TaxID=2109375 RepID=UPI0032424805
MPKAIIDENGYPPESYSFKLHCGERISIGRADHNYITLKCPSSSTHHCDIERVQGGYILLDNASTNGITKDGVLMEVIDLRDSIEVLIGQTTLRFQLSHAELEELKGEGYTVHEKLAMQPESKKHVENAAKIKAQNTSTSRGETSPSSSSVPPQVQPGSSSQGASRASVSFIIGLICILAGWLWFNYMRNDEVSPAQVVNGPDKVAPQVVNDAKKNPMPIAVGEQELAEKVETSSVPEYQSDIPYLRRGVEVEVELKGMMRSHRHKVRENVMCYTLTSFDDYKFVLPRLGRNTVKGVDLSIFDGEEEIPAMVKVSLIGHASGDIRSAEVKMLFAAEKLDPDEGQRLLEQSEARKVASKQRVSNPSPNALPYSGKWGVRMPIPSEKNGIKDVNKFDPQEFAAQIAELKTVDYVILNVTQPSGPCYFTAPHPELEKILKTRDYFSGPVYPDRGSFPRRDILGETLNAVRATGKKTLVYFACEGFHTGLAKKELQDVWFDHIESLGMTHYQAVGQLILKHYVEQYGTKIDGWWFDGSGGLKTAKQRQEWRDIVLAGNPKSIVAFNRMAGPPFRSTPQCDYFGGHPTPRSRHKFWEPVNLPMITAIEASPWMNCNGEPVGDPQMSTLGHVFMGLQDRWTLGKCAFPPEQAVEWTTRVIASGGMYTWASPRAGSKMAAAQFNVLKKIDKALAELRNVNP